MAAAAGRRADVSLVDLHPRVGVFVLRLLWEPNDNLGLTATLAQEFEKN
jgi:hypothetical protein